jgi:hypothetical protein
VATRSSCGRGTRRPVSLSHVKLLLCVIAAWWTAQTWRPCLAEAAVEAAVALPIDPAGDGLFSVVDGLARAGLEDLSKRASTESNQDAQGIHYLQRGSGVGV